MAGTNAVAAKQALVAKIAALEIEASDGGALQVAYSWPGRDAQREVVHGGKTTFNRQPMGYDPRSREEALEVTLWIVVVKPGADVAECETRAVEIGTVIEEALAADPKFAAKAVPGLLLATVEGGELDGDFDDDGAAAILQYRVGFTSHLR